ncbi:MAG TPA: hypothetical protein VN457_05740, partial [Chlamydiales bacterium]|nr:hypothetical protein [Chlamydiales bacterium]
MVSSLAVHHSQKQSASSSVAPSPTSTCYYLERAKKKGWVEQKPLQAKLQTLFTERAQSVKDIQLTIHPSDITDAN